MPSIAPFFWFDSQAEEAMNFYVSVFPRSKVLNVNRAGDKVMAVEFELQGQKIMAMNAGPAFTFNESFSWFVGCETQDEIDDYWTKLTADGGEPGRCGWLKDRFGMSWQIVPNSFGRLMSGGGDPARSKRVMDAFFQMSKFEIAQLQAAYDGK